MRSAKHIARVIFGHAAEISKLYAKPLCTAPRLRQITQRCSGAILNNRLRELLYVNAGHVPPFIVRQDGFLVRASDGNLPIGLMPSVAYRSCTLPLLPETFLLRYQMA